MNIERWVVYRQKKWKDLENLLKITENQGIFALSPRQIQNLGSLYRAITGDLSRARQCNTGDKLEQYLNSIVGKAHNQVYTLPPVSIKTFLTFLFETFPITLRKNYIYIIIGFVVFLLGSIIAMLSVHLYPTETEIIFLDTYTISKLDQGIVWTDKADPGSLMSSFIMTNNIKVACLAFAYGLLFGVGSLYMMFLNGFSIGGTLQVVIEHGVGTKLLTFMAAHGTIELTTIFIAGGAGFMIGWALLVPGNCSRWQAVRKKIKDAGYLILGCIPLLVIAGIIEGFISPNPNIPPIVKYSISLFTGLALVCYFLFCGRSRQTFE